MKKISFPLVVILLISIIITLIGYNTLITRNERKKYQNIQEHSETSASTSFSSNKIIYCIGDSLTLGSHAYPNMLSDELTNYSIETFGGSQDQTIDMAIRLGRIKIYVHDITIPSQTDPVEVTLYDEDHEKLDVLKNDGSNFSNVEINGISGILKYDEDKKTHTFTRDESGEEVKIKDYSQVTTDFPSFNKNGIAIIFTGTYDPYESGSIFKTITYQRAILNQLGIEKYIVVSLTSKRTFQIVDDMNDVLKEEHDEHFLDFRDYILENGLDEANITPTSEDLNDLSNDYIPRSLVQDNLIDGNTDFNQLLAEQLIEKMKNLKYINDNDIKKQES